MIAARSPDGRLSVTLHPGAALTWSVTHSVRGSVLVDSELGLVLADGRRLGPGVELISSRRRRVRAAWAPRYGIRDVSVDHCDELTAHFRDRATGLSFGVVVRAYDEGVAVRYVLGAAARLQGELTRFRFPPATRAVASRDEGEYQTGPVDELQPVPEPDLTASSDAGPLADLPVLAVLERGTHVLIAESDRLGYPRAMLRTALGEGAGLAIHLMRFPGRATGYSGPGDTPAEAGFDVRRGQATPWRVLIIAETPSTLIERADLVPTLASANRLGDVGWIRPGRAYRIRTYTTAGGLEAVDFAARRRLEYVEFDAHWYGDGTDPSDATRPIPAIDVERIVAYGRARGVGLILYVDRVPAMQQLGDILRTYRRWGVAGVKFGFVWQGRASDEAFIYDLVKRCGEHRLLVNLHDDLRPAGLERTLPNCITVEGVRGNEHFPTARHNVTLPFVRNVAGPMDYTICYAHERNRTTNAHQLAMAVVYYNPLNFLYWYDQPAKYASGFPELAFFDACPTSWDDTVALGGAVGDFVAVARRAGGRWFLGAMTNERGRRLSIPLKFLGEGRWRARIFADGPEGSQPRLTPVEITTREVASTSVLDMDLTPSGGQAVIFERV
ncbi:glycoside hydrolase family 97 catalytic domain-containing protein [Phenylobacterium sp. LjRoot225]|uniref:glycoside hydrolase family 97 protein n=1 Tax=Phenylobacterium sp. LjRoot225 TaxID=3342285 RepID=UPI003ECFEF87